MQTKGRQKSFAIKFKLMKKEIKNRQLINYKMCMVVLRKSAFNLVKQNRFQECGMQKYLNNQHRSRRESDCWTLHSSVNDNKTTATAILITMLV